MCIFNLIYETKGYFTSDNKRRNFILMWDRMKKKQVIFREYFFVFAFSDTKNLLLKKLPTQKDMMPENVNGTYGLPLVPSHTIEDRIHFYH